MEMVIKIALGIVLGFILILLLPIIIPLILGLLALAVIAGIAIFVFDWMGSSGKDWVESIDGANLISSSIENGIPLLTTIFALVCFGFLISDRGTLFLNSITEKQKKIIRVGFLLIAFLLSILIYYSTNDWLFCIFLWGVGILFYYICKFLRKLKPNNQER